MTEDEDFAKMFEASQADAPPRSRGLDAGGRVSGQVVAIGKDFIFLDIGTKSEARVARYELENDDGTLKVDVGDSLSATVSRPDDPDGPLLVVSFRQADLRPSDLQLAVKSGLPVEGPVTAVSKGGLEVQIGGLRAFCPASHVDLGFVADLQAYVGQRHFFRVLEVRDRGHSIILSRKLLLEDERQEAAQRLLTQMKVGAEMDGIVQAIKPYGAFVDLGGVQGLVHVSELGHGRVARPEEVVAVGESVRVKVLAVESSPSGKASDAKISLSMKALVQPPPQAKDDEVLTATVSKFEAHGVRVDTPSGPGFIATRDLGLAPGADPRRALAVGTTLDVLVVRKDRNGQLRLSAAGVEEAQARREFRRFSAETGKRGQGLGSLGELLQDAGLGTPSKSRKR